jgi:soluble lytic murein transglycosylase-like protein
MDARRLVGRRGSTPRRRRAAASQRRLIAERRREAARERRAVGRKTRRPGGRRRAGAPVTLLVVPAVVLMAGGGAASADYEVRRGDTLSAIARQHGTSVAALAELNGLSDPNRILAGQRLDLPSQAAPASPAAPDRAQAGAIIERVATAHGWSPAFVKALAWQESGWQQDRVSSAGAIGIMQVMPDTGRFVSRNLAGRNLDLNDPEDNVLAGVLFLQYVWELTDRDVEMTLAGYYQGLASVRHNGMYESTERYIANVLALRDRFR